MNVGDFVMLWLLKLGCITQGQQLQHHTLTKSTRASWQQGIVSDKLLRDATIKKQNGVIRFAKGCTLLKDSHKSTDYYEHEYVGDFAANRNLKVVRRELYNGNEYVVIDARNVCKSYTFNGQPYGRNTLLVNFDETESTDRSSTLDVWRITPNALVHVKKIALGKVFPTASIRFSVDGKSVLFADEQAQFWSVTIP